MQAILMTVVGEADVLTCQELQEPEISNLYLSRKRWT